MSDIMRQEAPYPYALADLVHHLDYKGWDVHLAVGLDRGQGSKGLTLVITREGPDTYHPEKIIAVNHYMPVPPPRSTPDRGSGGSLSSSCWWNATRRPSSLRSAASGPMPPIMATVKILTRSTT